MPNDATSYDPIRAQSGRLSLQPQLTGSAGYNIQQLREHAHSKHSTQQSAVCAIYCSVVLLCLLKPRGNTRVKTAAVRWNSAPLDISSGPASACMFMISSKSCHRDTKKQRSLMCDGFALINDINSKRSSHMKRHELLIRANASSCYVIVLSASRHHIGHLSSMQTVIWLYWLNLW